MGVGVSQLTMPKIKNKGAGASVNMLYKIRMRYLSRKWVYRAKNFGRSFLNGASQYAHGDFCVCYAIYVVALSTNGF